MKTFAFILMTALAVGMAFGAAARSARQSERESLKAWAVCMWQNHPAEAAKMQEDKFWSKPPKSYLTPEGAVDIDKFCRVASPRSTRIAEYQRQLRSEGTRRARARYVQCMVADKNVMAEVDALSRYAITDADRSHYRPIIEANLKAFDAKRKAEGLPGGPTFDGKITDMQIARQRFLDQPPPASFMPRVKHCDRETWRSLSAQGNVGIKDDMLSLLRARADGGR